MARRTAWVKWPSAAVNDGALKLFHWNDGGRGEHVAAMMCWIVIAHQADQDTGLALISFDDFNAVTGMSRGRIAKGLAHLRAFGIIDAGPKRGTYQLTPFDPLKGWAMLPNAPMYRFGQVDLFNNMSARLPIHLDALKLLLLYAARRDTRSNTANISYDKIMAYTSIPRQRIAYANAYLAANHLVFVETRPSTISEGVSHRYRLNGINPYVHPGTTLKPGV